jgi:tripartite-type tricarboxylate transporter receptor subunit TctC
MEPVRVMMSRMLCHVVLAVVAGWSGVAAAETWPDRPIKAVIPFSAGSATDIIPRAVFEQLAVELGEPIVVENRGGAGGTIGVGTVAKAEPDGYTILANSSAHTVAPWIIPNLSYDTVNDLTAVIPFGKNANVLVVLPSKGWKTVQDLVAAAKRNPGSFNYGSAGVGTATHISAERFRLSAGFEATHIPYKGGPEALTDVLGGRIDFYYCPLSTAIPLVRDGRLLALAVSTPTRASALPDVPSSIEAGYPNSDYTIWYGAFMPAKTPPEIVERFYTAAARVLKTPKMQEKLAQLAVDPMPMTSAEFNKQVVDEIAANAQLVKAAGIK